MRMDQESPSAKDHRHQKGQYNKKNILKNKRLINKSLISTGTMESDPFYGSLFRLLNIEIQAYKIEAQSNKHNDQK